MSWVAAKWNGSPSHLVGTKELYRVKGVNSHGASTGMLPGTGNHSTCLNMLRNQHMTGGKGRVLFILEWASIMIR